jgi:hypothetical protein
LSTIAHLANRLKSRDKIGLDHASVTFENCYQFGVAPFSTAASFVLRRHTRSLDRFYRFGLLSFYELGGGTFLV